MDDEHDDQILAILFDVDGCLISTGGAGTKSWRDAFDRLHGIPADIGQFTEAGMTDPEVGRLTFARVLNRNPTDQELRGCCAPTSSSWRKRWSNRLAIECCLE